MKKVLKWLGLAWCTLAGLFIFISMILIWYYQGFGRVIEIFSPFNIINVIAVAVTLSPGLAMLYFADKDAFNG